MNGQSFVILGYVIGLGLLWGYAATLWWESRRMAQRVSSAKNSGERS